MTRITAYSILKELGTVTLQRYIYEQLPSPEFDSHDFTNSFVVNFGEYFNRMLEIHSDKGSDGATRQIISRLMGDYLGKNRVALMIEKIGEGERTLNLNGTQTKTSLWRKTSNL